MARFAAFAEFLDANDLTVTPVSARKIDDDFSVSSSDLTDEGLQLMRTVYEPWARQSDRGRRDPADTSLLAKKLAEMRRR